MSQRTQSIVLFVLIGLVLVAGCRRREAEKDYDRQLRPGERALREVPPSQWPTFRLSQSNRAGLQRGIELSLGWLAKPSAQKAYEEAPVPREAVVSALERFQELLASGIDEASLNRRLRQEFRILQSVGWDGQGTVLFTGYYTPIFTARRTPTARFRYPLYKRPDDLVSQGLHRSVQRLPDGSTRPYPDRKELTRSGALDGLELAYLAEPFDPYIIQVQGSAKLRLVDGGVMEIGMHGTTGHQYVPIALQLVEDGRLRPEDVNLASLRQFFRDHPDLLYHYTEQNPRFVFFTEAQGGPFGSIGVPVTADVTVATDKKIFPPGALCFVDTTLGADAGARHYAGFRLDQDTGGAIQAPGRCDLYMGEGSDAERRAGQQRQEGRLYYLLAK